MYTCVLLRNEDGGKKPFFWWWTRGEIADCYGPLEKVLWQAINAHPEDELQAWAGRNLQEKELFIAHERPTKERLHKHSDTIEGAAIYKGTKVELYDYLVRYGQLYWS